MSRSITLVLTTLALLASLPANAQAFIFGTADSHGVSETDLEWSTRAGARVARMIVDPNKPIERYDAAIQARRNVGLRPQIVIGGLTTTSDRDIDPQVVADYARAVVLRWPDVYAVSFINEPDLQGMAMEHYYNVYRTSYRAVKRVSHVKVLLGEFSPHGVGKSLRKLASYGPLSADGFAWHAYDFGNFDGSIVNTAAVKRVLLKLRSDLHTPTRKQYLPMYVTEYGQPTRGPYAVSESVAVQRWVRAMRIAGEQRIQQLIAYHVMPSQGKSVWDTSLIDEQGNARPAYEAIFATRTH